MLTLKALLIALGITLFGGLGALAGGHAFGWGNGWGHGGSTGGSTMVGAPGPIAGVGLPVLAVAGGLMWVRSRRRRKDMPEA